MLEKEHIVSSYDEDLRELDNIIAEMGGRVERMLGQSVKSLVLLDTDLANIVIEADKAVDDLETRLDAKATQVLALRQPVAADLRLIIATLRTASDLERMGDYARNISKRAITLNRVELMTSLSRSLERMAQMVQEMISQVLDAFISRDADAALQVIASDEDVDLLHTSLFREILTYMMEDPRNITACTHFMFIAKNIERIGDHATNIAEQIHFVAKGSYPDEDHMSQDSSAEITAEIVAKED